MLNTVTLMGRLTREPELRYTGKEIAVTNFSLAVGRDNRNQDGGYDTDFFECVCWRRTAEFASKFFHKGSMAVVVGRLQNREWTDKDGNKRHITEVRVDNLYFGETKKKEVEVNTGFAGLDDDLDLGGVPF